MKVTERITRTDFGHIEIVHAIEDPKTFSRPWTFTPKPTLLKGELIEYICQENNKDVEHLVGKVGRAPRAWGVTWKDAQLFAHWLPRWYWRWAVAAGIRAADPNNATGSRGRSSSTSAATTSGSSTRRPRKSCPAFPQDPAAAHDLAVSPDLKTVYIPVYGDGVYNRNPNPGQSILIVDLAGQKVAGTIDIAPHQAPHGIQIDASGKLYGSATSARFCSSSILLR